MPVATAPTQSLTERFAFAVELVLRGFSLSMTRRSEAAPLAIGTWNRLKRLVARFSALVAAVEAGRVSAGRRTPARKGKPRRLAPEGQTDAQVPSPKVYGWLLTLAPELNTRIGRAQIEALLADPAFLTLTAQAPQVGRILRPLCHMLRIERPECLRLASRPRRPRSTAEGGADGGAASPKPARQARRKPRWLRWPKSPPLPGMKPGSAPAGFTGAGPPED